MQDQELAQHIEKLIEVTDMDLGEEPQNEYIDLLQQEPKVTSQFPPPQVSKPIQSEQGEATPLDDDTIMDV